MIPHAAGARGKAVLSVAHFQSLVNVTEKTCPPAGRAKAKSGNVDTNKPASRKVLALLFKGGHKIPGVACGEPLPGWVGGSYISQI